MKRINIILFSAIMVMVFSFSFYVPKASAIPVMEVGGNLMTNILTTIEQTMSTVLDVVEKPSSIKELIQKLIDRYGMPAMKQAAIKLSNAITQKIIGGKGSGSPQFVQDWGSYLYSDPQKKASAYINSFLDQTSRGMMSSVSGGIASGNYSSYLVSQARQGLQGVPCDTTVVQNYASNPSQLFANGNMRGLMAYTQPCGNPYSYSAIVQDQFQRQLAKEQNIAEHTQVGGWLPRMQNGQVTVPANLFSSALQGADQMGNNMIVNAATMQELATAMAFRTGATLMQYQFGNIAKKVDGYTNTAGSGYTFVQNASSSSSSSNSSSSTDRNQGTTGN